MKKIFIIFVIAFIILITSVSIFVLNHSGIIPLGQKIYYAEDFGLTPLVLINSNLTKSIDVFGYNYFKRESSITNGGNYDKIKKQADDFLIHFKFLKSEGSKISGDLSVFYSYIANSVLIKATTLKGKDYKKYIKELKRINAFDMLLDDSIGRKIKKILIKFSPKIYYRIVGK